MRIFCATLLLTAASVSTAYAADKEAVSEQERGILSESPLTPISIDSVGVLTPEKSGLPASMWQGTSRMHVEYLLQLLPKKKSASPTLNKLRYLLLANTATPPEGKGTMEHFLGLRVSQLGIIGESKAAEELFNHVPESTYTEDLYQKRTLGQFASGDFTSACATVQTALGKFDAPIWQYMLITCQVTKGDFEKASLSMDLLREANKEVSDDFKKEFDALKKKYAQKPEAPSKEDLDTLLDELNDAAPSTATKLQPLSSLDIPQEVRGQMLATAKETLDGEGLIRWWDTLASLPAPKKLFHLTRLMVLLESYGITIPKEEWPKLLFMSTKPNETSLLYALDYYASQKQVGAALACILIAFGDGDPAKASDSLVHTSAVALNQLGLNQIAAALSQEALIGADSNLPTASPAKQPSEPEKKTESENIPKPKQG